MFQEIPTPRTYEQFLDILVVNFQWKKLDSRTAKNPTESKTLQAPWIWFNGRRYISLDWDLGSYIKFYIDTEIKLIAIGESPTNFFIIYDCS